MTKPIDGDPAGNPILPAAIPEINVDTGLCRISEPLEPFTLVIFGATGDLTARKLIPALFNLHTNRGLPERFTIVGCGRTKLTDDEFRNKLNKTPTASDPSMKDQWRSF
ncbi:MAG: hypothetical protein DSY89_02210, partial [Deltaproteobacteria bacterium]